MERPSTPGLPDAAAGDHHPGEAPAIAGAVDGARHPRAWGILALAVVAAVCSFGVPTRLVWDDLALIGDLQPPADAAALLAPFGSDLFDRTPDSVDRHYYRPLVQLTYLAGAALWDREPVWYGLSNLAFHLLACGLLFALLRRHGTPPHAAALGTVLFGLLPRLTESVFWISGRTDLLAGACVLAALLVWDTRERAHARRMGAALLIFLGLLCKEVALAGAAALVLTGVARAVRAEGAASPLGARLRRSARELAPIVAVVVGYALLRLAVLPGTGRTSLVLGAPDRLALAGEALARYAVMLATPLHPALRIGHAVAPRDPIAVATGAVLAAVGVAALLWALRRAPRHPETLGLVLAAAALAPALHLVPFGSDSVAADRFLYLPAAGLVLAATAAATRLPRTPARATMAAATALALLFAAACLERARQWSDEVLLWHHTVRHADPIDAVPHAWLGMALLDRGEPAAALAHFEHAVTVEMSKPDAYRKRTLVLEQLANGSTALSALGRDAEALRAIEKAIHHRPGHAPYHAQRARLLARMLRFDAARTALATAEAQGGPTARYAALAERWTALEQAWRTLPAPSPDEPAAVLARRAEMLGQLGADVAAAALWARALARPDAGADTLAAAARFHALREDVEAARPLVEQLAARPGASDEEVHLLREVLAGAERAPVPAPILSAAADLAAGSGRRPAPGSRAPGPPGLPYSGAGG